MSKLIENIHNGVIVQQKWWEDNTLITRQTQDTDPIFEQNAEMRKNPDKMRNLEAMQLELTIPELDYAMLTKANPDLTCDDAQTRVKAWKKFIASPESLPYRVRDHKSTIKL